MPEPEVIEAPAEQKKAPALKLDSSKSLSSQANKLTELLKAEPAKKDEPKNEELPATKPGEEPKPKEEPKVPPPADDEDEEVVPAPVNLGPVGKFILDKLPMLQTRIKDGEGVKVVQFKDVSELPAGFELVSDADRAQFTVDVTAQVGRAKDALGEYRQAEQNEKMRKYNEQEAKDVAADLKRLQKRGVIGAFEKTEDDPDFNSDPNVKVANAIYKLFKDTNTAYMQANKTYRITYEDAADKYFAQQARTAANDSQKAKDQPKEVKKEKTPAQKEREQVAKQTGAPSGGEPSGNKPKVKAGMRMSDINKLFNAGRI